MVYIEFRLRFLVYLGLANFSIKFETKIMFTLETNLNKHFETNAEFATIADLDGETIWTEAPYIEYKYIRPNDNFRQ